MPNFKIMIVDDHGATVYDETVEAAGPMEACAKAAADAKTADTTDPEWRVESGIPTPFTMDT